MPIDPDIALKGRGLEFANPVDFLTHFEGLRQKRNANQLFQQQNDAKVGLGEIFGKHVGPDGEFDSGAVLRSASQDPRTAFILPDIAAQMQAREKEKLGIQQANVANAKQRADLLSNALGSLAALDNPTPGDVYKVASRLMTQVADKKFTFDLGASLKDMPKDSAGLKKWIEQHHLQALSASERFALSNPAPIPVGVGGSTELVSAPRVGGQIPKVVGSLEHTPTPGELNAVTPRTDSVTGAPVPGTPRFNIAPTVGGKGTTVTVPGPEAPNTLGPSQVQAEMNVATAKDFAQYQEKLNDKVASGQQNMLQIEKLRSLMEAAGHDGARIGAGAETRAKIAAAMQALGADQQLVGLIQGGNNPNALAAYQEFLKKTWSQSVSELSSIMPSGNKLAQAEVMQNWLSSPNPSLDPAAVNSMYNFATKVHDYALQEQEFMQNWEGEPRKARAAWTQEALKRGLVKVEQKGSVPPVQFINTKLPEGIKHSDLTPGMNSFRNKDTGKIERFLLNPDGSVEKK